MVGIIHKRSLTGYSSRCKEIMATLKAKKRIEKEAFEIVEIQIEDYEFTQVLLENDEVVQIPIANNDVCVGDYYITQNAEDRYHCPRSVVDEQYDILE